MHRFSDQETNSVGKIWSRPYTPESDQHAASAVGISSAKNQHAMIEMSHRRSMQHGLEQQMEPDFSRLNRADLTLLIEQNKTLYTYALPVMETLYEQIADTHGMVILTDANGLILHTLVDEDFLEKAARLAIKPGIACSEESKGTNAIATTIAEKIPTRVHASEHYLDVHHVLTCSATPIFDHQGELIGVLDVTGDYRGFHKHTMALARMSAQMIENQLFSAAYRNAITLHFHSRPEFIGTLMEGIASFTPDGRFLSANRSGLFQLGLPLAALHAHTFSSLFGQPVSALFDHHRTASPVLLNLCLHSGVRVFVRAELRLENHIFQHATIAAREPNSPSAHGSAQHGSSMRMTGPQAARRLSSLHSLDTGDPQIAAAIHKVNKVKGRDIPILIGGETGTGKDLFAQAIHNDSPHSNGPFVAVNCASIPETLIESELFGYEDGAFTGARKKGSIGKIVQANGGSLFLDEIGDMPLSLQARLLRVLQERIVTPLGSAKSIPVNVAVICATNRNLRELIAQGKFREDLYYRLNGLVIKLPPLRERTDLDTVINKLLVTESNGVRYTMSPDVMQLFKQHGWPGNFRQLTNLLRTAMVMADDDNEIRLAHLPDDFLEDIGPAEPREPSEKLPAIGIGARLEDVELSMIQQTLAANGGNVSATAKALGISRNTIYRKLQPLQ